MSEVTPPEPRAQLAWLRIPALIALGVVFPLLLLVQAYVGTSSLNRRLGVPSDAADVVATFKSAQPALRNANDYALYSHMFTETANEAVLTNKQVMKVVVVQIGFAVMSLGLMFVILGISDGGGVGRFGVANVTVDFRTTSTGVLVFVVGAAMAAAGGLLKNEYRSNPEPNYVFAMSSVTDTEAKSLEAYRTCKAHPDVFEKCFASLYEQVNKDQLQ